MAFASFYLVTLTMLLQQWSAYGQFPRICTQNITDRTGVCCPSWIGANGQPLVCGGPSRGMCLVLADAHEHFFPPKPDHMNDDRLNWPKAYFTKVCHCFGNRAGYACHECKFGYYGTDCQERRIQKRHNILSLSKAEQKRFIDLVLRSKTAITDYVAVKPKRHDPWEEPVTFVNLTLHDFFVYTHFYSARHTDLRNDSIKCDNSASHFDFSHEGSGFPTFHRLLMLLWEREFQKLAGDDTFMFPYWDWVENGHTCEVCTNDLLGAINYTDPKGHIDRRSPFYKWYTMCHTKQENGSDCRVCDPEDRFSGIVRRPVKEYRLPTLEEVDLALSYSTYDRPPYNEIAGDGVFRSCFEGGCPMPGQTYSIHNLVHGWFNGSLSGVTTSTNDPLFIVHHAMIDKLFERWIRMHKNHMTQMPEFGAPVGHHRDSVVVPMFPRYFQHMMFTDSRSLGYDYDNFDYGKHHRRDPESYLEIEESESYGMLSLGLSIPFVVSIILVLTMYRQPLHATVGSVYYTLLGKPGYFQQNISKPLINGSNKRNIILDTASESEFDIEDISSRRLLSK